MADIYAKVGSLVLEVAEVFGDSIFDTYTTAKTYVSHRYIGKEGQVYSGSGWSEYWDTRSREDYKHYFASYVNQNGYTRTHTRDYTRETGYSPIKTELSTNYNNSSEITYRAWYNWKRGYWAYPAEYGY